MIFSSVIKQYYVRSSRKGQYSIDSCRQWQRSGGEASSFSCPATPVQLVHSCAFLQLCAQLCSLHLAHSCAICTILHIVHNCVLCTLRTVVHLHNFVLTLYLYCAFLHIVLQNAFLMQAARQSLHQDVDNKCFVNVYQTFENKRWSICPLVSIIQGYMCVHHYVCFYVCWICRYLSL